MSKTGILIINTGTPDAPTPEAIRSYLREMLSDRHLVNAPRAIWAIVLNLFILPFRPRKTQHRYKSIWTENGSAFMVYSKSQRDKLQAELDKRDVEGDVVLAMRYGNPSIESALTQMKEQGYERIMLFPLYPQYARVTVQTCLDEADRVLDKLHWVPEIEYVDHYCDEWRYLEVLATSISQTWKWKPGSKLMFSYHSTLMEDIDGGDPYYDQCMLTSREVARWLGIPEEDWGVAWQSRFDSRRWITPSPREIMEKWAEEGVRDVTVVCPGFSTDCTETLVEFGMDAKAYWEGLPAMKGLLRRFTFIPCLNDQDGYIQVLAHIVEKYLTEHL